MKRYNDKDIINILESFDDEIIYASKLNGKLDEDCYQTIRLELFYVLSNKNKKGVNGTKSQRHLCLQ